MSATTAAPPLPAGAIPDEPPAYRWRWLVLAVILVAEVMDLLDSTVVNVAAPSIRADLGGSTPPSSGSPPATRWPSRSCSDHRRPARRHLRPAAHVHHRRAGFTLASAACALALSPELLIALPRRSRARSARC